MTRMSARERIKAALGHQTPDRIPIDIGGSNVTTMVDTAYDRLKALLGVDTDTTYMNQRARQVMLDEVIATRLHTDTRPVLLGQPEEKPDIHHPDGAITDEWQVTWKSAGGHYNPVGSPLSSASLSDLDHFRWPNPDDPGRTRGLRDRARQLHEESDYSVILSLPVAVVHHCQYLRGFDQYLIDLVSDVGFAEKLMDCFMEVYLQIIQNAMDAAGSYLDAVTFGDDIAFQDRLMVKPSIYRKLIKPRHKQIIDLIKSKSDAAVLYHCCGSVFSMIPDFIEIGVDALNPVQVSAKEMADTARLKKEYGADICFWGGIDTQQLLPFGTPEEVRVETRRRIHDLAEDGGFVLAAVHDIQEDVPPENILAMVEAACRYRE